MGDFLELDTQEVTLIVDEAIETIIGGEEIFIVEKLQNWNDSIVRLCLDELANLKVTKTSEPKQAI